ncbi:MAG: gliding motility-associated ABC transporter ATP-binding subunit GldA [Bacteroidota bacterium]
MSVVIDNLVKKYDQQLAVDHISFEASPGRITGFLGPNGAGKSTTMKIANGFIHATAGDVVVLGKRVSSDPFFAKKNIGYLPEHNPLYLEMYVKEYLSFVGSAYGLRGSVLKHRITEVIQQVGLQVEQHKRLRALSKGYRQRVGLGQALLSDPPVLVLDEPTTGLDPNQLVEIRQLIRKVSTDKTVVLSTHIMQEVEAICDRVVIINRGKIVADDDVVNLKARSSKKEVLVVSFEEAIDPKELQGLPGVEEVKTISPLIYEVVSQDAAMKSKLLKHIAKRELPLSSVKASGGSLEEIFHQLTQAE